MNFELNKAYNENLLDEIQFTLQDRKEPTIVMMSVEDYDLQKRLLERLKEKLPKYQFYDIDLTPFQVESLQQTLQKKTPQHILNSERITYCVNVFGLENSRLTSENGQIIDSGLIAQLNFEREVIFRKPNYITILWGDHDFFLQIQRQAPDLWSWITNFFVFKQDEKYQEKALSLEPEPIPAKLPIREEYINGLLNKLDHLPLNDPDKGRAMRERLNLYSLLADEYAKYFDYENAKKYYENAIGLSEKLNIRGYDLNKLIFDYGSLHLNFRRYDLSLMMYEKALKKMIEQNEAVNIGATYHQIGTVYSEINNFPLALLNYDEAIEWKTRNKQFERLGNTYHQIGTILERFGDWTKALENYQKALEWKLKSKRNDLLGATYQHIGRVYQAQGKYVEALVNYQVSIEMKKQTGMFHELGFTYFQIGSLYTEQSNWIKALENYENVIYWNEKTGQNQGTWSAYDKVGLVYEIQKKWSQALDNYQKALSLIPDYFEQEKVRIISFIERLNGLVSH
ncbi:MAG: tetratricopeptide repeat protein [Arcicella sp.]|nr:tetratricopeptide repeat protein [Arcicella sp.]